MPAHISREYRIYLALWRKAYRNPDGTVAVKTPNLGMAVAMRQGMYRAIRPFRQEAMNDEELKKSADKYVIYLEKGEKANEPHWLHFKERKALTILEAAFDALGIDEEDLLLGDERALQTELVSILENTAPAPRGTKFYSRD